MGGMQQIARRRPSRTKHFCRKFCRPGFVRPGLTGSFCWQKPTTGPHTEPDEYHAKYDVWHVGGGNICAFDYFGTPSKLLWVQIGVPH